MESFDSIDWENERAIENALSNGGITFNVAYAGCIEITSSVKTLDRDLRTLTACECINRLHDMATKKARKRKIDKRIKDFISEDLITDYNGHRVIFTISSQRFEIKLIKFHEILAKHEIPNISFASIGEGELSNYIGYVGKDALDWRACYVLDCGPIRARRIIKAIHITFQLRCKKFCSESSRRIISYKRAENVIPNVYQSPRESKSFPTDPLPSLPSEPYTDPVEIKRIQLQNEIWFHGPISREKAESLLTKPGDFLVRESSSLFGQVVLSCFNGQHQHIHLTDEEGKIRTRNKNFQSINEFVEYHFMHNAPIIAPHNIEMYLIQPKVCE